jgi:muramoyltetrapeptide carboxypeptidase
VGSAYDSCVRPAGHWLVLEDFNDKLERADRFLAHLTLARYWDECNGILLGDFHKGYEELTCAVRELLLHHIPTHRQVPILETKQVGHVWPMSPLPLHVKMNMERTGERSFALSCLPATLRTV